MAGKLARGSVGPAESIVPVTPNDSEDLPNGACRGLLCGTGGALTIVDGGGATRTAVPMQVGYNPIVVQRVFETGSTADNIWALHYNPIVVQRVFETGSTADNIWALY